GRHGLRKALPSPLVNLDSTTLLCDFRYSTSGTKPPPTRTMTAWEHSPPGLPAPLSPKRNRLPRGRQRPMVAMRPLRNRAFWALDSQTLTQSPGYLQAVHRPHGHDNPAGVAAARAGVLRAGAQAAALLALALVAQAVVLVLRVLHPGAAAIALVKVCVVNGAAGLDRRVDAALPVEVVSRGVVRVHQRLHERRVRHHVAVAAADAVAALVVVAVQAGHGGRAGPAEAAEAVGLGQQAARQPDGFAGGAVGRQDGFALPDLLDHLSNVWHFLLLKAALSGGGLALQTQTLSMGELDGQTKWLKLAFFFSVIGFCLLLYTSFFWGGAGGQAVAVLAYLFYVATVIMVSAYVFVDEAKQLPVLVAFLIAALIAGPAGAPDAVDQQQDARQSRAGGAQARPAGGRLVDERRLHECRQQDEGRCILVLVQVFLDRRSHYNTTKGFLSGSSAIAAGVMAILALVTGG
uniref:DUF2182 domain-containing protein n=1 Tax=Macrostomum lignano TaxID=282301 RepID=A0A1I8IXS9_9PLAT